jgi:predicted PurR-regulated permease PerM
MNGNASETRTRILRLFKNSLKLGFVLVLINLLRPELSSLMTLFFQGFAITNPGILNFISLIFVIYFGYFILSDSKFFLNKMSTRLGAGERDRPKTITYDIAAIISLVLISQLLTPFLDSVPQVGNTMATILNLVLLGICFFLVYHLAVQGYEVAKRHIETLIEGTKQIMTDHEKKTPQEDPQ